MTLKQWLEWKGVTHESFGKMIGRPQQSVTGYTLGRNIPRKNVLEKIEKVTDGAVTILDFYRD